MMLVFDKAIFMSYDADPLAHSMQVCKSGFQPYAKAVFPRQQLFNVSCTYLSFYKVQP